MSRIIGLESGRLDSGGRREEVIRPDFDRAMRIDFMQMATAVTMPGDKFHAPIGVSPSAGCIAGYQHDSRHEIIK